MFNKLVVRSLAVSLLLLSAMAMTAHAGLAEAEKNYRNSFVTDTTERFEVSPFEGWYLSHDISGKGDRLFTEDLGFYGFSDSWNSKGANGKYVKMNKNEVDALKIELRKSLKTDWMIPAGYGAGDKTTVVFSAPDCPACSLYEASMLKFGKQLDTKVVILPYRLGGNSMSFVNAVLCGKNPESTWKEAMTRKVYAQSSVGCKRSEWLDIVMAHTFEVYPGNKIHVKTPAIIRPDGTVVFGWNANPTFEWVSTKMGAN